MLRWGARKSKFGKLLGLYVLVSGLGTLVAILSALLLPPSLYVWVFGSTFFGLKETFALISPAVLFLGLSAPIGHYLHAQNRFKELIVSYGLSVLVLFLCWQGVDVFISNEAIGYHNSEPLQFMDHVMLNVRQHFGKLMAVNMAFFVLLLSNYLQVRKDIQWQGISFVMRYFGQRRLAK
jgi:O-antigen/teichoic acid export membrane protein